MKETRGKANPKMLNEMFKEELMKRQGRAKPFQNGTKWDRP